jgi:hypothetical protein
MLCGMPHTLGPTPVSAGASPLGFHVLDVTADPLIGIVVCVCSFLATMQPWPMNEILEAAASDRNVAKIIAATAQHPITVVVQGNWSVEKLQATVADRLAELGLRAPDMSASRLRLVSVHRQLVGFSSEIHYQERTDMQDIISSWDLHVMPLYFCLTTSSDEDRFHSSLIKAERRVSFYRGASGTASSPSASTSPSPPHDPALSSSPCSPIATLSGETRESSSQSHPLGHRTGSVPTHTLVSFRPLVS